MTTTLPTRIKQNLRDQITSETSTFGLKSAALQKTLGYPLHLDPEWAQLWATLKPHFEDPSTFIPYVSNVLIAWCDAFTLWLEDTSREESVEKFLESIRRGRVVLCFEISPSSAVRPTTTWSVAKSVFIITLPNAASSQINSLTSGFCTDFSTLFTSSPTLKPTIPGASQATSTSPGAKGDLESWALDSPESQVMHTPASSIYPPPSQSHLRQLGGGHAPGTEDFLPDVSSIARPEELLKTPPYWLIVRQEGSSRVTVQGSHGPSLALLENYLKKWCRGEVNLVHRPPIVEIRLLESAFGLGMLHDTLTLDAQRHREVSAMLVLVFVETVLGYQLMPSTTGHGSVWEFRRTRGFR